MKLLSSLLAVSPIQKDLGLLLIRLVVGLSMLSFHGWGKISGGPERWAAIGRNMENLGVSFLPAFWGFMAAGTESVGSALIVLGLFFRPAALLLAFTMLVAALRHLTLPEGEPGAGWRGASHALELLAVYLGLFFTGAGRFALVPSRAGLRSTRVGQFTLTGFFLAAGCLLGPGVAPGATSRGVVFEDRNQNRTRDPGEPGIPDIGVSNGKEIVRTDAEGRYAVDVDDDSIVFVIKPRGWRTPIDDNQVPRFYYIHRPGGSADLEYPGTEPTGPLPRSVDFPLYLQDEPEGFHALLFGDPQPRDQTEIDYLAHDVVEDLIGSDASFGVTLGDILYDDLSLFHSLNATIALIGIPWYNVVGNHDINYDAKNDRDSNTTFESVYGPPYYSFDYGPVHFLVLDDVTWRGKVVEPGAYPGSNYTGGLGSEQLEFIRRDLETIPENQLVVLFMHIPLIAPWVEAEREHLYRLLEQRPFCVSISAHYHYHEHVFLTDADGWRGPEPHHHVINVTTCGSWWSGAPDEAGIPHTTMRDGAPNGYTIMNFDGVEYTLDFRAARRPADHQMHIWAPERAYRRYTGLTEFLANVYNGSERSRVEYRIREATDWAPMDMVRRRDPLYEETKTLEDGKTPPSGRSLPRATDSSHIWRALLPHGLDRGQFIIEVRETDMWGRVHTGSRSIRVE